MPPTMTTRSRSIPEAGMPDIPWRRLVWIGGTATPLPSRSGLVKLFLERCCFGEAPGRCQRHRLLRLEFLERARDQRARRLHTPPLLRWRLERDYGLPVEHTR